MMVTKMKTLRSCLLRIEGVSLKEICAVNIATVEGIINESVCESCNLDPLPTWLLKDCITDLALAITWSEYAVWCHISGN